jgi:hypothetical protein
VPQGEVLHYCKWALRPVVGKEFTCTLFLELRKVLVLELAVSSLEEIPHCPLQTLVNPLSKKKERLPKDHFMLLDIGVGPAFAQCPHALGYVFRSPVVPRCHLNVIGASFGPWLKGVFHDVESVLGLQHGRVPTACRWSQRPFSSIGFKFTTEAFVSFRSSSKQVAHVIAGACTKHSK